VAKNVPGFCLLGSPFSEHFGVSPNYDRSRSFSATAVKLSYYAAGSFASRANVWR